MNLVAHDGRPGTVRLNMKQAPGGVGGGLVSKGVLRYIRDGESLFRVRICDLGLLG